jgi:ribulose-5-phosphate 4-epimerase/fuculose-1-phosphate aldolase
LVLRNHGLLTVGRNPAEAFWLTYHFERSADAQLKIQAAAAAGGKIVIPPPEVCEQSSRRIGGDGARRLAGQREWPALLRLLEKLDPSYRS